MSIPKVYKGAVINLVKCKSCQKVSWREEPFYDISLPIKGKKVEIEGKKSCKKRGNFFCIKIFNKNITNSLEEFTAVEVLEKENAYFCENCKSKQTAEKSVKFKNLPLVLNVHLNRFEYDWNRDVRVKLGLFAPLLKYNTLTPPQP